MSLLVAALLVAAAPVRALSLSGKVTQQAKDGLWGINKGADDGVVPGMTFHLLNKKGKPVGLFLVMRTQSRTAEGVGRLYKDDAPPAPGDKVAFEDQMGKNGKPQAKAIPEGLVVPLALEALVSSQLNRLGEQVPFKVSPGVRLGSVVVIPEGTRAMGVITKIQPAKGFGRSGQLEMEVRSLALPNGVVIPLELAVGEKRGTQWAKAAAGAYMTGLLGGGAVKGKKVELPAGKVFLAQVTQRVAMAPAPARAAKPRPELGWGGQGAAQGGQTPAPVKINKKPHNQTRLAFLGLQGSYANSKTTPLTEKLNVSLMTYLAESTPFRVIKPGLVRQVLGESSARFFDKLGPPGAKVARYRPKALKEAGEKLGVDFVIVGDVLKYSVQSKQKSTMGILGLLDTAGTTLVQKNYYDYHLHLAVLEVKSGGIVWSADYPLHHEDSIPVNSWVESKPYTTTKIGNTVVGHFRRHIDPIKQVSTADDPKDYLYSGHGLAMTNIFFKFKSELEGVL